MFTGIIQQLGTIKIIKEQNGILKLTIEAPKISRSKKNGDSIAVDGICLTVTSTDSRTFSLEAIPETQKMTIISAYKKGSKVNLENPLKIGEELGGHFVSGHVDFISTLKKIFTAGESKIFTFSLPRKFIKFFALKGSVTVNGVSLTISDVTSDTFEVSLIPETLKNTNLSSLEIKDQVNIEVDLISRYLDSLLKNKSRQID